MIKVDEFFILSVTDKVSEVILYTIFEIATLVSVNVCQHFSALIDDDNLKFHKLYKVYNLNVA